MQARQSDYFTAYQNVKLRRDDKGALVEGASSADLVKSVRAEAEPPAQKGRVA